MVSTRVMKELRQWRLERHLTLKEAATLIGVSAAQWSRYESGRRRISPTRVAVVSNLTGISVRKLRPDMFDVPRPAPTETPEAAE